VECGGSPPLLAVALTVMALRHP